MSSEELAEFLADGWLTEQTHIPVGDEDVVVFSSRIVRGRDDEESRLTVEPYGFTLVLSPADCNALSSDGNDGVYVRREWTDSQGHEIRFVAYIEKDKKARKHAKAREND